MLQSKQILKPNDFADKLPVEYISAIEAGELYAAAIFDAVGVKENYFGLYVADFYGDWSELVWITFSNPSMRSR